MSNFQIISVEPNRSNTAFLRNAIQAYQCLLEASRVALLALSEDDAVRADIRALAGFAASELGAIVAPGNAPDEDEAADGD